MPKATYTLAQFLAEHPDDDACLQKLFNKRFGHLTCCPNCGVIDAKFSRIKKRRCFACEECRYQIYPAAGTIYHRSTTSLWKWFLAVYYMSTTKNGMAARELHRHIGGSYKTAWRMKHQIRKVMKQDITQLSGIVEADEAYIGGRRRSSNRFSNKTPLLGVVERQGSARVLVTDHASASTAMPFLYKNVMKGSVLHTDESGIYNRASRIYDHHKVKHSDYEFVREDDYTNTIEGFWGLLKPSWKGTYRWVSKKYMQSYVDEFVWRYNHRDEDTLFHLLWELATHSIKPTSRPSPAAASFSSPLHQSSQ